MHRTQKCFHVFMLILIMLLSGCSNPPKQVPSSNSEEEKSEIVITDCENRQVTLPSQVDKIGCLYAFTGHAVTLLGRGEDIVAVNKGLPRDKMLLAANPAIENAVVASGSGRINIEELLTVNPDVVFIEADISSAEREKLDKSNIPYLVVDFNSMQAQMDSVWMIGQAIQREEKAQAYIQYYLDVLSQVKSAMQNVPEKERVTLFHSINEATRSYTKNTLPGEWTAILAENVSFQEDLRLIENKQYASLEQILLWDPQVIFANEDGVADYILTDKRWSGLVAVKNKQVYQMPVGVSRWGHPGSIETPLGILWSAQTLYPHIFAEIDIKQEMKWFYQEFFHYSLTDEEVSNILNGRGMRILKSEL